MNRWRAPLAAFAIVGAAAGFLLLRGETQEVAPWLQVKRVAPLVDIPHVMRTGKYDETLRVRDGSGWKTVLETHGNLSFHGLRPAIFDDGKAALIGSTLANPTMVLREGTDRPYMPSETCHDPYVRPDNKTFACLTAMQANGRDSNEFGATTASVRVDVFDATARHIDRSAVAIPEAFGKFFPYGARFRGWTEDRVAVIELEDLHSPNPACILVALDTDGGHELARARRESGCPSHERWTELIRDREKVAAPGR